MNGPEGYVLIVKDYSHDVLTPKDIMEGGNHFDNCPRAARRSQRSNSVANNELLHNVLLNHVIDSHKTQPHTNMQFRNKK